MAILILAIGISLVWTPYAIFIFEKWVSWLFLFSNEKNDKQIKTEDVVFQLLGIALLFFSLFMLMMGK